MCGGALSEIPHRLSSSGTIFPPLILQEGGNSRGVGKPQLQLQQGVVGKKMEPNGSIRLTVCVSNLNKFFMGAQITGV